MKRSREVLVLNQTLERIFNKVYSVNESMSSNQRELLIMGFEDGINELFGKWTAKAMNLKDKLVSNTKKTWNSMVDKGKEYYEKGKKLAGDAWESMQKFANNVVNKVKESYNSAVTKISSGYDAFKSSISNAYQESLNTINQAYNSMKNKGEAFVEACKGVWADVLKETSLLIQKIKEKMGSMKNGFNEWVEKNKSSLTESINKSKSSGIESMNKLSELASSVLSKSKKVARDIGFISFFMAVASINLLLNGIKSIPGIYDSAVKMVNEFIEKEIAEHNKHRVKNEKFKYLKAFESFKN